VVSLKRSLHNSSFVFDFSGPAFSGIKKSRKRSRAEIGARASRRIFRGEVTNLLQQAAFPADTMG
jgi:hypothetical protein